MAYTKFKKRNLNRFRKVYPYIIREPRNHYCADREVVIEVAAIPFSNSSSETYIFKEIFPGPPYAGAISVDNSTGVANVSVFVSDINSSQITVNTSSPLHGLVHIHIIYVADY
jgi:hypothetical protein